MLRRALVAVLAAGTGAAALAGLAAGPTSQRIEWRGARMVRTNDLGVRVPAGWHVYRYGSDGEMVFVSSFRVTRAWIESGRRRVPDGEALVLAFTYGRELTSTFPARPAHFRLSEAEHGFYECALGLEGYLFRFRENGLAVQAELAFGEGTDPLGGLAVLATLHGESRETY